MKKHYLIAALMILGSSYAYADGNSQFDNQLKALQTHRAKIEAQLGLKDKYLHASSYYDDMEDHYEMWQITSDQIDKGIR
jgi:hypothetical protein